MIVVFTFHARRRSEVLADGVPLRAQGQPGLAVAGVLGVGQPGRQLVGSDVAGNGSRDFLSGRPVGGELLFEFHHAGLRCAVLVRVPGAHAVLAHWAKTLSPTARIAVAAIVENAGFGAAHAAPIVRRVFDYWLLDQYPNEEDIAATQKGLTSRPLGTPRHKNDVSLSRP